VVRSLAAAVCGAGVALGIGSIYLSLRRPTMSASALGPASHHRPGARTRGRSRATRGVISLAVGLIVGGLTRWPVAGVLGALAAAGLPSILRPDGLGKREARAEAIAGWTELLRDALSASAGIEQAIAVTASASADAIRAQVELLATRLSEGVPMRDALRSFAREVDDQAADYLACALLLAATARAQKLTDVLSSLAESIRDEVAMRLRVEAARASSRSSVRVIVVFSLAFALTLSILARSYLMPFGSITGQGVLVVVGACYAAGLALMSWLVRTPPTVRLLTVGSHQ